MQTSFVASADAVMSLVETIRNLPRSGQPDLYIDLEGIKLSRYGSISIVTVYVQSKRHVYLVDVHTLGAAAFDTAAADGTTLRTILQSPHIVKAFFDVRNDSDALHAHFGIKLQGIEDVQLMENASRSAGRRRYLHGLERCIESDSGASQPEKQAWKAAKLKGQKIFDPSKGGSYKAFNIRPMNADLETYCVNDVVFLPVLRKEYLARLDHTWRFKVAREATNRVIESQSPGYDPHGASKSLGPWEKPLPDYADLFIDNFNDHWL
ncbi:ribonuclease H-like domain-containing protein [Xylaria sp. CBS 124048]|nr:ribonuclease H-like domain-containing protein [Xylaria sp. CBS 124048]